MRTLLIAAGNCQRHDDGVAHAVLKLLDAESLAVFQLTPEVAAHLAGYDTVLFIDADAAVVELKIEPVDESGSPSGVFTHSSSPSEIVTLARSLYGFGGQALVCRIPVEDLSHGEGLSSRASALAAQAAEKLKVLMIASV